MAKRIKRNYDRGYVDARAAYRQAVDRVRCGSMVRVIVSKGELFLIRKDI